MDPESPGGLPTKPSPSAIGAATDGIQIDAIRSLDLAWLVSAREVAWKVRGRATLTALNGVMFAMGLSWRSAVVASVDTDNFLARRDRSTPDFVWTLWAIALGSIVVLLPLIAFCLRRRAALQKNAQDAAESGESIKALRFRGQEMSFNALVNWGLTFALAAQIDNAAKASIPTSPVFWQAVYVGFLMLAVCIVAVCAKTWYASETDGSFAAGLANTLISGATYVVVLAFLTMVETLFELHKVTLSEDAAFLIAFSTCSVSVAAVLNVMFAFADSTHAAALYRSAAEHSSLLDSLAGKSGCCCMGLCQGIGLGLRKFLGKVVAMCAVLVVYLCLHVALAKDVAGFAAVHEPLSTDNAGILLGLCTICAIFGGLLLDLLSCRSLGRMELQTKVPQDADSKCAQAAIVSAQALSQTAIATAAEALSWLVGCACHGFATSLWRKHVCDEACHAKESTDVVADWSYAGISTLLALVVSTCLPPPPKAG